jgi:UDP-N-acetylmuramoyl-tripeptide--D-alanyl-D-alanine ligase
VNNVGRAHIEFLGSEDAIARAKGEIFEALRSDGTAVINADDRHAPLMRELAGAHRRVEFGLEQPAPVTGRCTLRLLESEIRLTTPLGEADAVVPVPGLHNVRNALAAAAAATALGIGPAAIAAGLAGFRGVEGRLQRKVGLAGATVLDDTYNANPDSVRAAIAVLAALPGRRILVLGDMGELGAGAEAYHVQAGEYARAAGVDALYTLGELAAHAARAFGRGARHCPRIEELLAEAGRALAPDVTVLVKGSRFMQMERVVRGFEQPAGAPAGEG